MEGRDTNHNNDRNKNVARDFMEENGKTLMEYLGTVRRRKGLFFWPVAVLSLAGAAVAYLLPPVYRSTATILIEQQEIPQDLVRSTITSYADQRIQIISRRVMTAENLTEIIRKFDLYAEKRRTHTLSEILDMMRDDIRLEMISADVMDPRSGRPTQATIAFSLSYSNASPSLAQRVANELTSLYLNENLKSRAQRVAETTDFLQEEARRLARQVEEYERQLAEFKERNAGNLPEDATLNLQVLDRTEREQMEIKRRMRELQERKIHLQGQLAQVGPNAILYASDGTRILGPADRLKILEADYASAASRYSADHPDIVRMRKEIDALRAKVDGGVDTAELEGRLKEQEASLAAALERYAESHPDVVRLRKSIANLKQELALAGERGRGPRPTSKPDNPAYIQIQAQIEAVDTELRTLEDVLRDLDRKIEEYDARIARAPRVESEYRALLREYENAAVKYREIKAKQMEAQLAESLEKERKGERFVLLEPPMYPDRPEQPNRLAIGLIGAVFALFGGVATVVVAENNDPTVRGVRWLAENGAAPLAVVPHIEDGRERRRRRRRRYAVWIVGVAVLLLLLAAAHLFVMPLDVLWFAALRRLGV